MTPSGNSAIVYECVLILIQNRMCDHKEVVILFSLGVNGDLNSNGGKEANKFSADEQYPRLTISANNDHFEDSCCEVLKILLFQSHWLPIPVVHGS